ncbi:hypothetical protein V8F06_014674 [Rhypophila decipiens]
MALTSEMRTELNAARKTAYDRKRRDESEAGYVYWEDSRAQTNFLVHFVCVDYQGSQEGDMFLHKIGGGDGGGTTSRGLGGPSGGGTTSRGLGGQDRGFGLDDNIKGRRGKGGKRRPIWRRVCCFCLPCK